MRQENIPQKYRLLSVGSKQHGTERTSKNRHSKYLYCPFRKSRWIAPYSPVLVCQNLSIILRVEFIQKEQRFVNAFMLSNALVEYCPKCYFCVLYHRYLDYIEQRRGYCELISEYSSRSGLRLAMSTLSEHISSNFTCSSSVSRIHYESFSTLLHQFHTQISILMDFVSTGDVSLNGIYLLCPIKSRF